MGTVGYTATDSMEAACRVRVCFLNPTNPALSAGSVNQLVKVQLKLSITIIAAKFTVHQAWLNIATVLVLVAAVLVALAVQLHVVDLADLHAGVDPYRLHAVHFQSPCTAIPRITDAPTRIDEQSQSAE